MTCSGPRKTHHQSTRRSEWGRKETDWANDLLQYNVQVVWRLLKALVFDDVGMPFGGQRAPTPYFPSSGGLLYAVAMMAAGWDQGNGATGTPGFPDKGWDVRVEGIQRAM